VAAHSLLGKLTGLNPDELKKIRDGEPTGDAKRDALVRFVRTLAKTSGTVSNADFAAIKAAGYTDAQLVDISLAFATNRGCAGREQPPYRRMTKSEYGGCTSSAMVPLADCLLQRWARQVKNYKIDIPCHS
jgi:hypothetical protein